MGRPSTLAQICKFLAIFRFPFRDSSRPRARRIRTNTTRDLAEPRCVPPTTRPEHATLFPPTNGFYLFGISRAGTAPPRVAVRNRDLKPPRVQRGGGCARRRWPKLSRSAGFACLSPINAAAVKKLVVGSRAGECTVALVVHVSSLKVGRCSVTCCNYQCETDS